MSKVCMANFEAFFWNISSSTNPQIVRSDMYDVCILMCNNVPSQGQGNLNLPQRALYITTFSK